MNKIKISIWNRDFEIDARFCQYEGEEITQTQQEALDKFCESPNIITAKSISEVKEYTANASDDTLKADDIENIFKYVMPTYLFIPRSEHREIAIMCNFKFDIEHGIAVLFKDEELFKIGEQDIVL
ncbi:MAG: hypothetical protein LUI06_01060 [Ruminococcus sp.]|nr:hypothetical protein [Ruminococcus sp.]